MARLKKRAGIYFFIALMAIFPFAAAAGISVNEVDRGSTVLSGLNNPALYDFIITNNGSAETIEIYALAGMTILPRNSIELPSGETTIGISALPNDVLREQRGKYSIEYQISTKNSGIIKDELDISIVELRDSLSFSVGDIHVGDSEIKVGIRNLQNAYIDNLSIKFSSSFVDDTKIISLKPKEEKNISLKLNKDIGGLTSASYVIREGASAGNAKADFESSFKYLPREDVSTKESAEGIIVRTVSVEKTNNGNVPVKNLITIKKDVFSRLFTIYSTEPASTRRSGLSVLYTWEKEIGPAESFSVRATTNYSFPFFFILFIVLIGFSVYTYTRTAIIVTKRVSYVKTKGGEFALKVRVIVKAKKYVDDLQLIDKLPGMTMLYEKFGVKPDKVDAASRRLFWNVERLNTGEERVFSYIIYSKVRVVGRFELPSATAIFQREGKTHEVLSNRTFFVSETTRYEN